MAEAYTSIFKAIHLQYLSQMYWLARQFQVLACLESHIPGLGALLET